MATVSSVSICSNALLTLGAHPINDFNENTEHARLCANKYPTLRDDLLRKHPWNCAVKRVVLAPSTTAPAFGWAYSFTLPGDVLRILSVGMDNQPAPDYQLEGRSILANTSVLPLRYIWRNEDEASWDSAMIRLMEMIVAAELAYAVTASATLQANLKNEAEFMFRQAKAQDGQENPAQELGGYPSFESRFY
ncbi:hypothetical protein [Pantoea sp. BAV 3049]|uniref:hypothetical protein n=1 Tax=Pantoea sp. BAV 3049 TaxID=2654188 RepID=UPI00131C0BD8|nr:hypothetical protein [Pantoea sp. BAV 3049]